MSFIEVIIIYLSAGAPFGVLMVFSRRSNSVWTVVFYGLLATLGWPVLGGFRFYRALTRATDRRTIGHSDDEMLEVLTGLSEEVPTEAAEFFEIAGHPNSLLATNCYARARKRVIDSHIERLSKFRVNEPVSSASTTETAVRSPQYASAVRS